MSEFNAHMSGGGASRRSSASGFASAKKISQEGGFVPLHVDIDAPPKPWPFVPYLGIAFILIFFALQILLPATHYRDPFDPHRQWKPLATNIVQVGENSTKVAKHVETPETVNIFSWLDDLDIRPLAVVVNSTISNSRYPTNIYFHFFLPDNLEEEHCHHKLKALFPKANIVLYGHNVIREKVKIIASDSEYTTSIFPHVLAFYIPKIYQNLGRFVYIAPDVVVKDKIEDLFQVDLEESVLAAVEDCSQRVGAYPNFEIINAIQRSGAKPWVAQVPYDTSTCVLDLSLYLIDADKLVKENVTDNMKWWRKVLHGEGERKDQSDQAVFLALFGKYMKLDAAWNIRESKFSGIGTDVKIFHFDGENKPWTKPAEDHVFIGMTSIWWGYLSPLADQLLRQQTM